MKDFQVIIIGAGLGGLSAGAFLAQKGIRPLVLEKTSHLGGRCSRRLWEGYSFDVGACFFGTRLFATLKVLGDIQTLEPKKLQARIYVDDKPLDYPLTGKSFQQMIDMGLGGRGILKLGARLFQTQYLQNQNTFPSYYHLVKNLTPNLYLQSVFSLGGYYAGHSPLHMPAYSFHHILGRAQGYDHPQYVKGGSQAVADFLRDKIIEGQGEVRERQSVELIALENDKVAGVVVDGEFVPAKAVISNADIKTTALALGQGKIFSAPDNEQINRLEEGLEFNGIFLTLKRSWRVDRRLSFYAFCPWDLTESLELLLSGVKPQDFPCSLFLPDFLHDQGKEDLTAALLFLSPRGEKDKNVLEKMALQALDTAERFLPGFLAAITGHRLIPAPDYQQEVGFKSTVLPLAETINQPKRDGVTPVKGLYLAGSSVLPLQGSTAQAVESGRIAAGWVLEYLK